MARVAWLGYPPDQPRPLHAINDAGNAGRPNQQSPGQVGEAQTGQPFLFRAIQRAEDAPLRARDAEPREVRVHDALEQAEAANQFAPGAALAPLIRCGLPLASGDGHESPLLARLIRARTNMTITSAPAPTQGARCLTWMSPNFLPSINRENDSP